MKTKTVGTLGTLVTVLLLEMNLVSAEPVQKDYSHIQLYNRDKIFIRNEQNQLQIPKQSPEFGLVNPGVHYKPIKCGKLLDKKVQKAICDYFIKGIKEHYSELGFCEQESQDCQDFVKKFFFPQIKKSGKLGNNFFHVYINQNGEGIINFNKTIIIVPKEYAIFTALAYDCNALSKVMDSKNINIFKQFGNEVKAAYKEYETAVNLLIAGATVKELTD